MSSSSSSSCACAGIRGRKRSPHDVAQKGAQEFVLYKIEEVYMGGPFKADWAKEKSIELDKQKITKRPHKYL